MITIHRLYHVSRVSYSIKKQALKLSKLINPKHKKQWYPANVLEPSIPSMKNLAKTTDEPGKRGIRRIAMLNKMFMKQISDLMSTGTIAMDVVGRGIEISKVRVTPDFHTVNVYWICRGDTSDNETEMLLNKISGALRHELSTLRVMGEVPYIVFVKDRQEAHAAELDRRLAVADYGEDYVPTEIGHMLKTEFVLNTKLSQEMKAKIKQLEEEIPTIEEPIPEMTHNVYGLDHLKIMNRLLAAKKKTKDAWTRLEDNTVISYRAPETTEEGVVTDQRKELADFLLKRQIQQNKLYKEMRNAREDWQSELNKDKQDDEPGNLDDEEFYDDDTYYEDDVLFDNEKEK